MLSQTLINIFTAIGALLGILIGFFAVAIEVRRLQRESRDELRAEREDRRSEAEERRRQQDVLNNVIRESEDKINQLRKEQVAQEQRFLQELRETRRESREARHEQREETQERRAGDIYAIEERRLTEVNLVVKNDIQLTSPSAEAEHETPFVIFRLPVENIGDGPVDILASLVSSRILSSKFKQGIGLRSRDVEWSDYEAFFWDHPDNQQERALFAGISTTKNMVGSADHLIRLAAKEQATLRRIDGVNSIQTLRKRSPVYLMYRVFLVARGYPLGEILRQLGGGLPDPTQTVNIEQLNFRALAQPNTERWRKVQEAILNINRLAFRLATGERDPLGLITEPDAWRFFLLHHEDFADSVILPNRSTLGRTIQGIWNRFYPESRLPPDFPSDGATQQARAYYQHELAPVIQQWEKLKRTINDSKEYDPHKGYSNAGFVPLTISAQRRIPREGYPMRVHTDPFYRDRWLEFLREGYLVSRPFPRQGVPGYDEQDIPDDPRVLEPYVGRQYFFMNSINAGEAGFGTTSETGR
jgi:hypothetical protein